MLGLIELLLLLRLSLTVAFHPLLQDHEVNVPAVPSLRAGTEVVNVSFTEGIVGLAVDSVVLQTGHYVSGATAPITDSFDPCGGHVDKRGRYHYHLPPICLLKKWSIELNSDIAATSSPKLIGIAMDGFPIMALAGLDESELDQCNGRSVGGQYQYYVRRTAPFWPTCFRGSKIGYLRQTAVAARKACRGNENRGIEMKLDLESDSVIWRGAGCPDKRLKGIGRELPAWLQSAKKRWLSESGGSCKSCCACTNQSSIKGASTCSCCKSCSGCSSCSSSSCSQTCMCSSCSSCSSCSNCASCSSCADCCAHGGSCSQTCMCSSCSSCSSCSGCSSCSHCSGCSSFAGCSALGSCSQTCVCSSCLSCSSCSGCSSCSDCSGCSSCTGCCALGSCCAGWYGDQAEAFQVIVLIVCTAPWIVMCSFSSYWASGTKKLSYYVVGAWIYMLIPMPVMGAKLGWTPVESFYWSIQIITTLGYGDPAIKGDDIKLFASIYIVVGLSFIMAIFTEAMNVFIKGPQRSKTLESLHRMHIARLSWTLKVSHPKVSSFCEKRITLMKMIFRYSLLLIVYVVSTAYWTHKLSLRPGWEDTTWIDGVYFTTSTISTIGFGDIVPLGIEECIAFAFTISIGLPVFVAATASVSEALFAEDNDVAEKLFDAEVKRLFSQKVVEAVQYQSEQDDLERIQHQSEKNQDEPEQVGNSEPEQTGNSGPDQITQDEPEEVFTV